MDICDALLDCIDANIVHRDVKPANIMRRKDGTFVLIDFGCCYIASEKDLNNFIKRTKNVGTAGYRPSEAEFGDYIGADHFGLIVTTFEVACKRSPFGDTETIQQMFKFFNNLESRTWVWT